MAGRPLTFADRRGPAPFSQGIQGDRGGARERPPHKFREIVARALYRTLMKPPLRSILAALALLTGLASPALTQSSAQVDLRILAINDFHGNLKPPAGGIRIDDANDKGRKTAVPAGGAEQMATLVKQLRDGHSNNVFV